MRYVARVALVLVAVVLILFGGLFLLGEEPYWGAAVPLFIVGLVLLIGAAIPIGPRK